VKGHIIDINRWISHCRLLSAIDNSHFAYRTHILGCMTNVADSPYDWSLNVRIHGWGRWKVTFHKFSLGGSKQFPALRFWWVVITTLYHLMLQSWYQKTAQSLVNTLLSFSWHNRLPYQQYDLLKTTLITALGAFNSKMARGIFLYY